MYKIEILSLLFALLQIIFRSTGILSAIQNRTKLINPVYPLFKTVPIQYGCAYDFYQINAEVFVVNIIIRPTIIATTPEIIKGKLPVLFHANPAQAPAPIDATPVKP